MWIYYVILAALIIGLIWFLIKYAGGNSLSPETKKHLAEEKAKKRNTYKTAEFKLPKRIPDGDPVKPYPVPNSKKVNFYEKKTAAGEGFLHAEFHSYLWNAVNENRYASATVIRTEEKKGYIKIIFK